jgi:hypothetical protein
MLRTDRMGHRGDSDGSGGSATEVTEDQKRE